MKVVKTACNMGFTLCGLDVYVENGKIVKVAGMAEHPFNSLCEKAYAIPELAHSSERLTDPLRKIDGEWQKISWDEAFGLISDRLTNIKEKYGPEAVLVHVGRPYVRSHMEKVIRRFCDLYGTPNYTSGSSLCWLAKAIADGLTLGAHGPASFLTDTKCMLIWGSNPTQSRPREADTIRSLARKGSKLIVINPKATLLAKEADIHAQIRPGTDCALALGMLNVIVAEQLYDTAFIDRWTVGFNKLVEHVRQYPPERVEEITWVEAEVIRSMARMYATTKPAFISRGVAMDHCTNGIQANRAINTLMAITGNLDVPGGNLHNPGLRQTDLRLEEMVTEATPVGARYPLFTKYTQEQSVIPAIDQMLTGKPHPVKALLVAGSNPAMSWPNSSKVKRAFEQLDFLLVIDIFMTDTAKMADLVLPGTTFLERQDIRDYIRDFPLIMVTNKVIEPVGNSLEDWKIWAELGKRMGFGKYFPWKDTDELFTYLLKQPNILLEQLKQSPGGIYYEEPEFQKYLRDGFNTPSGKVEIYSQAMNEFGYDPLPTFHEPAESTVSRPDLAERYPLILITGPRTVAFQGSEYRNLSKLRNLVPEPLIEINPETASNLGIVDDDLVIVESVRGSIKIKAKLTEDIHPNVVAIPHGWSEANVNYLTDDEARDPVSAYPGFKSVMCRVTKAYNPEIPPAPHYIQDWEGKYTKPL